MAIDKGRQYPAKVLKCQKMGSSFKYFIHFQGWARKFDTWIDTAAVVGSDSKTVAVSASAECESSQDAKVEEDSKSPKKSASTVKTPAEVKRQKRMLAEADLVEDDDESTLTVRFDLQANLKRQLVDEWTLVANDPKHLIKLPRPHDRTVRGFMDEYLKRKEATVHEEEVNLSCYCFQSLFHRSN